MNNLDDRPSNPGFEPLRLEFPDGSVQILYMAGQVDPEIDRLTRREAELVKALEEARRDAERYRWLRKQGNVTWRVPYIGGYLMEGHIGKSSVGEPSMEKLDSAIDSARAALKGDAT